MNNAFLAMQEVKLELDTPVDHTPQLQEKEATLVKIIEAIDKVSTSRDWRTLKKYIFDDLVATVKRFRDDEASKIQQDTNKLHQLNGQLMWAEKYADISKMAEPFRVELANVRKQLHGTRTESSQD